MNLRTRLFLTSLFIAVPLAAALFLIDGRLRLTAKEQELRRSVEFDVSTGLHGLEPGVVKPRHVHCSGVDIKEHNGGLSLAFRGDGIDNSSDGR